MVAEQGEQSHMLRNQLAPGPLAGELKKLKGTERDTERDRNRQGGGQEMDSETERDTPGGWRDRGGQMEVNRDHTRQR